ADAQAWLNNPATNFGWMLITESERTPESARRFGSREDPSHAPVLVIGYLVPSITTQITTPTNNARILVGSNVTVTATVSPTNVAITNVDFFAYATNSAGMVEVTNIGRTLTSPFSITWTNPAVGGYALTAVAVDDL